MEKINYRKSFLALNILFVIVIAAFNGGRGAAMLIISIYFLSIYLTQKQGKDSFSALLISFVIHCSWVGLFCCLVLPWLKNVDSGLVNFIFTDSVSHKFTLGDSVTMSKTGRYVSVYGSTFSLLLPSLVVLPIMYRERKSYFSTNNVWSSKFLAISIPFGCFAVIKALNAWNAVAPFMSGDGRNNFLLTYAARSSALKPSTFIDVGILPNAVAGMISASNGASGVKQVADVWSIAFVYVLAGGFIGTAIVAFIRERINEACRLKQMSIVFVLGSTLIAVNPIALSFCLNDGFLSLYFSLAIASSLIVICQSKLINRWTLIGAVTGLLALMMCYVILVPSLMAGIFVFYGSRLRNRRSTEIIKNYIVLTSVLFLLAFSIVGKSLWRPYINKALLPGAVTPMEPKILIICVIILFVTAIYSKQAIRWSALGIATIGTGSLIQYSVIEIASGQFLSDSDSYYGTKIITATTFIVVTFTIAISIVIFICKSKVYKISNPIKVSILTMLIFFIGSESMAYSYKLPSALPRISKGWGYPSGEEISVAVDRWNGPPFLFLEYSKSLETSAGTWRAETQSANDRLLNFWSPIFWNIDQNSSKELYQWIYGQWNPADLKTMCPVLDSRIKVIITRSITLENRLKENCALVPRVSVQS